MIMATKQTTRKDGGETQHVASSDAQKRPIGVVFRLNANDHEVVTEYARDKRMSIQQLIEASINHLRDSDGLPPIEGRPRSKTRLRKQ